jgi:hypothetical protein
MLETPAAEEASTAVRKAVTEATLNIAETPETKQQR